MLMLVGLIVAHVKPDGIGVSERVMVPVKPFAAANVIVEFPEDPKFDTGAVAAIVKSTTVTVTV